ncbi:MAG TPA: hypothetical protein VMT38_02920 [Terracidiphilus sp.]|nr:hypothetical protein [Terracidiphilus sp.]
MSGQQSLPQSNPAGLHPKSPGGMAGVENKKEDAVVNDSLGTVDPADSTGLDEEKETGDAKRNNKPTRED